MLTSRLPYGTQVARITTRSALNKLDYKTVLDPQSRIPFWIDGTLRKAVHPNPTSRYEALSEFVYDLRHPNPKYTNREKIPLIERDPLKFWKGLSLLLFLLVLYLLGTGPDLNI